MKKVSDKQKEILKERAVTTQRLHALFREIWDEREDEYGECYCFETGQSLRPSLYRMNTFCYHHILAKSKHPDLAFVKENIVILHPEVHTQVESNIDKCPKVKELTIKMKEDYDRRNS